MIYHLRRLKYLRVVDENEFIPWETILDYHLSLFVELFILYLLSDHILLYCPYNNNKYTQTHSSNNNFHQDDQGIE